MTIALPLDEIFWDINKDPEEAAYFPEGAKTEYPITQQQFATVVLPGRDFTLILPFARFDEIEKYVLFQTDGAPVTLHDLLLSIYLFYQEEIPNDEMLELIRISVEDGEDEKYSDDEKRIDAMKNLIIFEGVVEVSPNVYRLNLGS